MAKHYTARNDKLPGVQASLTVEDDDDGERVTNLSLSVLNGGAVAPEHFALLGEFRSFLPDAAEVVARAIPGAASVEVTASRTSRVDPDEDESDEGETDEDEADESVPVGVWGKGAGRHLVVKRQNGGFSPDEDDLAAAYKGLNGSLRQLAEYFDVDLGRVNGWVSYAKKKGSLPSAGNGSAGNGHRATGKSPARRPT